LVEPIRNYIQAWKQNLEKMRKEMDAREKQIAREVPKAIFAGSSKGAKGSVAGSIRGLKTAITDDRIHLSDLESMGVSDITEYRDAFAELDQVLFGGEPTVEQVNQMAAMMQNTADKKANSAKAISIGSAMASQQSTDADEIGAFTNATQGAMQQSFNEFLRNYASHLSNIADTKEQLVDEAQKTGKPTKMAMASAPPPADAKLKMFKMDAKAFKQVQLSPEAFQEEKLGNIPMDAVNEPNHSGAGVGGGTAEGANKVKAIESSSQYMDSLSGEMGEGKSPIKILEDIDSFDMEDFSLDQYRMIYVDYTTGASDILNSEQIPIEIKSYIRDYFLSINPDKIAPPDQTPKELKAP
jgi:hypothetical protein